LNCFFQIGSISLYYYENHPLRGPGVPHLFPAIPLFSGIFKVAGVFFPSSTSFFFIFLELFCMPPWLFSYRVFLFGAFTGLFPDAVNLQED